MSELQAHAPPYRHVAWAYDALASAYSLGAIDRAKSAHHARIREGDRVLYAGAGRGREIAGACQRRAEVTCVEPSPAMAARLHRRLSAVGDGFTIIPRPIQSLPADASYDVVVAHFFLNVFGGQSMPAVLAHLCRMVRPGGRIIIADFKPAEDDAGPIDRVARSIYYRPVSLAGWLLGICALHPIYDYAPLLVRNGFAVESRRTFQVLPGLPPLYDVIIAQRP